MAVEIKGQHDLANVVLMISVVDAKRQQDQNRQPEQHQRLRQPEPLKPGQVIKADQPHQAKHQPNQHDRKHNLPPAEHSGWKPDRHNPAAGNQHNSTQHRLAADFRQASPETITTTETPGKREAVYLLEIQ